MSKGFLAFVLVTIALLLAALDSFAQSLETSPYCVPPPSGGTALGENPFYNFREVPDTGTIGVVVIFCAPANALYDTIPQFMFNLWDTTGSEELSIPRYVQEVTLNKLRFRVGFVHLPGNRAIKSDVALTNWQFDRVFQQFQAMLQSCLIKADSVFDFGPFDLCDLNSPLPNRYVDLIVYAAVGVDMPCWANGRGIQAGAPSIPLPSDLNINGLSVANRAQIYYQTSPFACGTSRHIHSNLVIHEFGHTLGFPDTYYYNHSALGSFCGMGLRTFRDLQPSPYNPSWLEKKGYLTAVEISDSVQGYTLPDIFAATNSVVRLKLLDAPADQHLLASYHARLQFWERERPREGVMIWHVEDGYNPAHSEDRGWLNRFHKPIDIEYASGLFYQYSDQVLTTLPEPLAGSDSLDLRTDIWDTQSGWGSANALWQAATQTDFDENSNPNSNFYGTWGGEVPFFGLDSIKLDGTRRDTVFQDIKTGIAVRNINIVGPTATADLYPGQCNLILGASTTFSGNVTLNSDLVIPSGVTLTIQPATNMKISTTRDRCQQLLNSKMSIIVEGNLVIQGTPSQPVLIRSAAGLPGFYDWEGIVVKPGGTATVSHASIKHAHTGISFENESASSVTYSTIDSCELYAIKSFNPQLRIEHNRILRVNSGYGVHLRDSCTVLYNTFGEPEVSCRLAPVGLRAENSNALIDSNTFWFRASVNPPCEINSVAAIEVDGKKSQTQPLVIRRCFIDGYDVGIDIAMKSNVRIEMCDLFRSPGSDPTHIGINDRGSLSNVVVRNTFISGFNTGVHTKTGAIDLGVWDGYQGGGNSIFFNCNHNHHEKAPCGEDSDYRFVTTNAIEGAIKAEGNRWVMPCSTSTCPNPDKVPDILDATPCGGFDYVWCGDPLEKRAATIEGEFQPFDFELAQNYPNPFNPTTSIKYSIPQASYVELSIYNLLGQRVAVLVDERRQPGFHEVEWNGRDATGREVASGVYFYRISAGHQLQVKKMIILK